MYGLKGCKIWKSYCGKEKVPIMRMLKAAVRRNNKGSPGVGGLSTRVTDLVRSEQAPYSTGGQWGCWHEQGS